MKVGTDGVLLGAWADAGADARRILDVGTGTGLIALMLAQRTAALPGVRITGVDVDDVSQARENGEAANLHGCGITLERGADGAAVLTVALARAVRATGREPQRSTGAY